ncbi:class I adenylate-forming enzyme family protein [Pectinatus haikarae]|uniref:class I adenylate-forming enzyme family protein n=1 Tax=Pectinatus haikarae TaxID=349096 RepID=UPI0018C5B42B|nr:AMP-binding protein [Pectinatus haikarae]
MLITDLLKCQPKDKICLSFNGTEITYGFLENQSSMMADSADFIKKGEKIFLQESDPIRQLLCFFAIIKAGGICVMANSRIPAKLAERLMKEHGITKKAALEDFKNKAVHQCPGLRPEDIFLGAMSSGSSTGIPQIVLRDHKSWMAAFPWQSKLFNIGARDVLYLVGEMAYTANLNACIHAFFAGASVIVARNRLPQTWLREMQMYSVSAVFMVPAHYSILLKAVKLPDIGVTSLVTGGAKIDRKTVVQLHAYFPAASITEYYGASELGHVSYADMHDLLERPYSTGKLFPGVSAQIVDGEVWVESPYLIPSRRPKATAGDLGSISGDGYLTLYGRKSGTVNIGGVKVQPEQIEFYLKEHPQVEDAAVFAFPDKLRGEKLAAAIVSKTDDIKIKEIFHFCRQNAGYSPQKIIFLQKIPLNANGKVDKIVLQKIVMESFDENN